MKKIIGLILLFCFLVSGRVFSQEKDMVGLVVKKVYEEDRFFSLGLDLGSLKNKKIEVYSASAFSKDSKDKFGEFLVLVVMDKLMGSGETVQFFNGPKPGEITLTKTNNEVEFKTVDKEIKIQGMAGGRAEIELFDKIMASEHHTYNLNSIVSSKVSVKPLDASRDPAMVDILKWLVKNNEIYNFSNQMDDEVRVFKHLDKKGNSCFLFYNPRTIAGSGNKLATAGTFFYVEKPEDNLLRRVLSKVKLNITVDNNSFEIFTGTDSGPDEVISNEEMLKGLIKDTFKDEYKNYLVTRTFSVKTVVTKEF